MKNTKKNIVWINTAKAIGIILVYFFHTEFYMGLNLKFLHDIYTPFFTNSFFFISGYLLFEKQLSDEILSMPSSQWLKSNTQGNGRQMLANILFKIAIPTIIFSVLLYFPKAIVRGHEIELRSFLYDTIFGGSIWFTCSLTVAELLAFIMLLSRSKKMSVYLIISIVLSLTAIFFAKDANGSYGTSDVPWFWKGGFIAILFMVLGAYYRKYEQLFSWAFSKKTFLLFSVLLYLFYTEYFSENIKVSINVGAFNIMGATASILGIILFIEITKLIPYNKCFDYLGKNTLVLYLLSGAIPNVMSIILLKMIGVSNGSYVIISALSFLMAIFVVLLVNKYLIFLTDLRKIKPNNYPYNVR